MTPRGHQKAFSWGAKHPTFCFAMKDRIMDTRILKRFEEDFAEEIKLAGNDPAARQVLGKGFSWPPAA